MDPILTVLAEIVAIAAPVIAGGAAIVRWARSSAAARRSRVQRQDVDDQLTNAPAAIHAFAGCDSISASPIVGRNAECVQILSRISDNRSVVISGVPASGKTTLLGHIVKLLQANPVYPFLVVCCYRMEEIGDPTERQIRLLRRISLALGLPQEDDLLGLSGQINARLSTEDKSMLLAVDNVDDIASREAFLAVRQELIRLTVVCTSRHSAWDDVDLEVISLPPLTTIDAVTLFESHLGRLLADVHERELVADICERCQRRPLSILFLAQQVKGGNVALADVLSSLNDFFSPDESRRWKRLESSLGASTLRLIPAIGVISAAAFGLDEMRVMCDSRRDDLQALIEWGLVVLSTDRERYVPHPTFLHWCRDRLDDLSDDEQVALRSRLARYYIDRLSEMHPARSDHLAAMDSAWLNVLGLFQQLQDAEIVVRLFLSAIGDHADDPQGYIPRRRLLSEVLTRRAVLLEKASQIGGVKAAAVEKNIGLLHYWRGEYREAEKLYRKSLDGYVTAEDVAGQAAVHWLLGFIADDENLFVLAEEEYRTGLDLALTIRPEDPEMISTGHHLLGCTYYHQGRHAEAEAQFSRAVSGLDGIEATALRSRIRRRQGYLFLAQGRLDDAEKVLQQALSEARRLVRPRDTARILRHLAILDLRRGKADEAGEMLTSVLQMFATESSPRGTGATLMALAEVALHKGERDVALNLCRDARLRASDEKSYSLYGQAVGCELEANILTSLSAPSADVQRLRRRARNIYRVIGHQRAELIDELLAKEPDMTPSLPDDIRAIYFDLMDTLAHLDASAYEASHRAMANVLGVSPERLQWAWVQTRAQASTGVLQSTDARVRAVARILGCSLTDMDANLLARQEESVWAGAVQLYPDTARNLATFRNQGVRIGVISNGPVAMRVLLSNPELNELVDSFVLSCDVGVQKPNEGLYEAGLMRLNMVANQCMYVGDGNNRELDAAKAVGFFTVKIERDRSAMGAAPYIDPREQSTDWDIMVRNLDELAGQFIDARG